MPAREHEAAREAAAAARPTRHAIQNLRRPGLERVRIPGMGDSRGHRGPHPLDEQLFSPEALPELRRAVMDLSWLRSRGYAETSAVKLVGDRYQLRQRQRVAIRRCACSDTAVARRSSSRLWPNDLAGKPLEIDGLNVITTIEVFLSSGVLLLGRDGCMRDMASFHGSYRLVHETGPAVDMLIDVVGALGAAGATAYIDRPVSNSGRLAETIRRAAATKGVDLEAITADRVDDVLASSKFVVATSDSAILDACSAWLNLARLVVERHADGHAPMWLLDLSCDAER